MLTHPPSLLATPLKERLIWSKSRSLGHVDDEIRALELEIAPPPGTLPPHKVSIIFLRDPIQNLIRDPIRDLIWDPIQDRSSFSKIRSQDLIQSEIQFKIRPRIQSFILRTRFASPFSGWQTVGLLVRSWLVRSWLFIYFVDVHCSGRTRLLAGATTILLVHCCKVLYVNNNNLILLLVLPVIHVC